MNGNLTDELKNDKYNNIFIVSIAQNNAHFKSKKFWCTYLLAYSLL